MAPTLTQGAAPPAAPGVLPDRSRTRSSRRSWRRSPIPTRGCSPSPARPASARPASPSPWPPRRRRGSPTASSSSTWLPCRTPALSSARSRARWGCRSTRRPRRPRVIDALVDKEVLLVVDNCEQVLAAGLDLTEPLRACPGVRLLVTSRERLHLAAEREFPVGAARRAPLRRRRRSRPPGRGARGRDARRAGALCAAHLRGDGGQRAGRHGDLPTARRPPPRLGAGRRAGEALHPRRARRPAARPHGGADHQRPRRARPAPHAARRPRVELRPARRARTHAVPQALGLRRRVDAGRRRAGVRRPATPTCWTSWARCWTRAWCAGRPRAA